MGLDKEVFTDASNYLDRVYEANIAAKWMYSLAQRELAKAQAIKESELDHVTAMRRATILTVAYKLAVKDRDKLFDELKSSVFAFEPLSEAEMAAMPGDP